MPKSPEGKLGESARGFEFRPSGQLLRQTIEIAEPMGIAYERSVGYSKDFHVHDRTILVCPRGASVMRVRTRDPDRIFEVNSTQVLVIPSQIRHDDEGMTAVYDTMALLPSANLLKEAFRENRLGPREAAHLQTDCFLLKRSRWLDDLLTRYFLERVLGRPSPERSMTYLEKQILNEILALIFAVRGTEASGQGVPEDSAASTALEFIEVNLFEPIGLKEISRAAGVSVSTILRAFKEGIGQTPHSYIMNRRLDEARALLISGEYGVRDVAVLVGYENLSSFTRAYRLKFKSTPSLAIRGRARP